MSAVPGASTGCWERQQQQFNHGEYPRLSAAAPSPAAVPSMAAADS